MLLENGQLRGPTQKKHSDNYQYVLILRGSSGVDGYGRLPLSSLGFVFVQTPRVAVSGVTVSPVVMTGMARPPSRSPGPAHTTCSSPSREGPLGHLKPQGNASASPGWTWLAADLRGQEEALHFSFEHPHPPWLKVIRAGVSPPQTACRPSLCPRSFWTLCTPLPPCELAVAASDCFLSVGRGKRGFFELICLKSFLFAILAKLILSRPHYKRLDRGQST